MKFFDLSLRQYGVNIESNDRITKKKCYIVKNLSGNSYHKKRMKSEGKRKIFYIWEL